MMKRLFTLILLLNTTVVVYAVDHLPPATIAITEIQSLSFNTMLTGTAVSVVTAPTDANAAIFDATGEANQLVTVSIVENSVKMDNGGTGAANKISIASWTFGGSLSDVGGSGVANFNALGVISNMRVGATAVVESKDNAGLYQTSVTMRLVYQ